MHWSMHVTDWHEHVSDWNQSNVCVAVSASPTLDAMLVHYYCLLYAATCWPAVAALLAVHSAPLWWLAWLPVEPPARVASWATRWRRRALWWSGAQGEGERTRRAWWDEKA